MGVRDVLSTMFSRNAVIPPWLPGQDNLWPFINFGGNTYPMNLNQTLVGNDEEAALSGGNASAYSQNGIIFACMAKRMKLFSEARASYQRIQKGKPGDLWGDASLDILDHPWAGGAMGDLLARAIQDADWMGNFYVTRDSGTFYRMRPDWCNLIIGGGDGIKAKLLGLAYYPDGEWSGSEPILLQRSEFAHFAPYPDPYTRFRGMSWLTPVLREIAADNATTNHKLQFFRNGATPNMIVKRGVPAANESFKEWVAKMRESSEGTNNAYKTFYMSQGADATVVGKDFQQIEFRATQGAGEVRIIAASGLHPVIVGVSESLQGSSLNSGNIGAARRLTADTFLRPDWRNFFASMEMLVPPPKGSRLWYDDTDIPFLREDSKDAAVIEETKASTIVSLIREGFKADDAVKAVAAGNLSLLIGKHTGLVSVQLQPPGTTTPDPAVPLEPTPPKPTNGKAPAKPAPIGGKA
jgi:hypothetical protein